MHGVVISYCPAFLPVLERREPSHSIGVARHPLRFGFRVHCVGSGYSLVLNFGHVVLSMRLQWLYGLREGSAWWSGGKQTVNSRYSKVIVPAFLHEFNPSGAEYAVDCGNADALEPDLVCLGAGRTNIHTPREVNC